MANKKIKNASKLICDNISFKSNLEVSVYKHLLQAGFKPKYEEETFTLIDNFTPTVPFYGRIGKDKNLVADMRKIRSVKYTPDFIIETTGKKVFIEVKGFENDVFYLKKKLFRRWLENNPIEGIKYYYFEIFTISHLKEALSIILQQDGS